MNRTIKNVFEYYDYRQILHDDFLHRSTKNHQYSFRAYSRDLGISAGFLTDLLAHKKDLSPNTGEKIFSKLQFKEIELQYCVALISLQSKTSQSRHLEAQEFIDRHYKHVGYRHDERALLITKSAEHFLVYGLARRQPSIKYIRSIFKMLGLSTIKMNRALSDFAKAELIQLSRTDALVRNLEIKISYSDQMIETISSFTDILLNQIQLKGHQPPERTTNASILFFDEETFNDAVQARIFYIKKLNRLSQATKKATRLAFFATVLFSMETAEE